MPNEKVVEEYKETQPEIVSQHWQWFAGAFGSTVQYFGDVFCQSLHYMKQPLSWLLVLSLLAMIIGSLTSKVIPVFQPLCILPGISSTSLCHSKADGSTQRADYPGLVKSQTRTFELLLDETAGGSGLALDIKKAEMATVDLITVIKLSKLASKDTLAETLSVFVQDARKTGRALQRLSSKVGGAIDQIIAFNDYAARTISEMQPTSPSFPYINYLSRSENDVVLRTFSEAMNQGSRIIQQLILEAEVSHARLERLEEILSVVYEIVYREDSTLVSAKSELLSQLWTKLGWNHRELKGYEERLELLQDLAEYRKQALAHVVSALQTLNAFSDDLDDIRERVTEPELAALAGSVIPVEVQIKSLELGLQQLKSSRVKARGREEAATKRLLY